MSQGRGLQDWWNVCSPFCRCLGRCQANHSAHSRALAPYPSCWAGSRGVHKCGAGGSTESENLDVKPGLSISSRGLRHSICEVGSLSSVTTTSPFPSGSPSLAC